MDWTGGLILLGVVCIITPIVGFLLTLGGMYGMQFYNYLAAVSEQHHTEKWEAEYKPQGVSGCSLCEEGEE